MSLSLKKITDTMFYGVQIALYFLFFMILWRLWVSRADEELIILPFEISISNEKSKEKYKGNLISNILTSEINQIKYINQSKYAMIECSNPHTQTPPKIQLSNVPYEVKGISSTVPTVVNHDNFEISTNVGSMALGGFQFSIQEIFFFLRKLCWKNSSRYISGSLHVMDSNCRVVALMRGYKTYSWDIDICQTNDEDFNELMRDLAYQIYYDLLNDKNQQSDLKNWKCLRYFTEALHNYQLYTDKKQIIYLEVAEKKIDLMKEEGAKECPLIYGLLYNIGYAYFNESNYRKAKDLFIDAYDLGIASGAAPIAIVECLFYLNEENQLNEFYEKAIKESEKRLDENPKDIFEMLVKAFSCYGKGDVETALSIYENIAKTNRDDPYIGCWLSNCYSMIGKHKKALKVIERTLKEFPKNSHVWSQMSIIFHNKHEQDKALNCCEKALELYPNNFEALSIKSNIISIKEDHEDSVDISNKAIRLGGHLAVTWSIHGLVLGRAGKYKEALEAHDVAIRKGKNKSFVWYNRANTCRYMEDDKECRLSLEKAFEIAPFFRNYIKSDPEFREFNLNDL